MTIRMASSVRAAAVYALVALLALRQATATFRVIVPVQENATAIDHELALFGRPNYGGNIVAPLVLAPSYNRDSCHPFNATKLQAILQAHGITQTSGGDDAGDDTNTSTDPEGFVLLLERGGCHFVDKVRHAQTAGAVGVVVYDTGDDAAKLPVLADDGTGSDIRIPSIMIHHGAATELMELLKTAPKMIVTLNWDVPHPDDRVEVSMWFSSRSSQRLHAFMAHFRPVVKALGDRIAFTPFYDVHLGSSWGCTSGGGSSGPTHCPQLCVYDQTFCTYDPEQNNTIGLDGKDVLEEDVRQLCIYAHHQDSNNSTMGFWDYMVSFNDKCSVPHATSTDFNQACSQQVQEQLGIPLDVIQNCSIHNGKQLLQSQIDALRIFHVIEFPELTVNGVPLYGSLTCEPPTSLGTCAPLQMICAGFQEGTAPAACHESYWREQSSQDGASHSTNTSLCEDPLEMDDCGSCSLRSNTGQWNAQCAGCDGLPNSGKQRDECGVCGGHGTFDLCGRCLSASDPIRDKSCLDCKGVVNGFASRDACGVCGGHGSFDACGLCLDASDPRRQNFHCHVMDDPDAIPGKLEIQGIHLKQFHGEVLSSFQSAVASTAGVQANQVLVKSVDDVDDPKEESAVMVLFFIACESDMCRVEATKKLQDPSASLSIAMKIKAQLDEKVYGLEIAKTIGHIALHAVGGQAEQSGFVHRDDSTTTGSGWWPWPWPVGAALACAMTLAVGVVLMRVRDDRLRRDFHELVGRYTPLTAMMDEEEEDHDYEYGRAVRASAGAAPW